MSWKIYLAQCELAKFTWWIFELITPRRKLLIYERKLPKNDSKNLDSNVWRHWSWKNIFEAKADKKDCQRLLDQMELNFFLFFLIEMFLLYDEALLLFKIHLKFSFMFKKSFALEEHFVFLREHGFFSSLWIKNLSCKLTKCPGGNPIKEIKYQKQNNSYMMIYFSLLLS